MDKQIENSFPEFEDMGEVEAKAVTSILQRFLHSYAQKPAEVSDADWLTKTLTDELPEKSPAEIQTISQEIVSSVTDFEKNLTSIHTACDNGQLKEQWFKDKVQEACSNMSVNDYGNYLANIDRALYQANEQMIRTVERHGECFNLDGFIAEQQHVNDFNAQAALENRNYRAYVEEPEIGKGYAKNSFDVVIKDKNGKIIHQYQFKFGKDAAATIRLLKSGNYNNQQLLVPAEQVEEVQKAFPDKTVTDHIGGTDKVPTKSKGLTKAEVKNQQLDAQEKNKIEIADWNSYSVSELAIHLGKNAALTGAISARNAVGFHIAKKILSGEKIEAEEVVEVALKTGVDVGVKTAAAGALKVAVEKGLVPVLAKGTPAGLIANIAAVAVENAKIMAKFARGEIGGIQAMDYIARTTTAAVSGMVTMGEGATIGAALFSVIPVVGTVVGGVIGGAIGYIAGSKVGELVYSGAKAVVKTATTVVKAGYNAVKSVGSAICSGVKSVVSGVGSAISSFGGWVSSWF